MSRVRVLLSCSPQQSEYYAEAVHRTGGEPLSFYCPPLDTEADLLLLGGGGDVDPAFLGLEDAGSRQIDPLRDAVEFALVRRFLAEDKAIFGICRGHQVLNLALGGTLCQDIGLPLERFHSPQPHGCSHDLLHGLWLETDSFLGRCYGTWMLANSHHHQAIRTVGAGMRAIAWSESGLIEATEHQHRPLYSVQFHPERLPGGDIIFAQLLSNITPLG